MAKNKNNAPPEEKDDDERHEWQGPRPFWSGTISFGLVSLPVSLFMATRSQRVALRMIDADGQPLSRRYFCPKHAEALEADEIVRGYEIDDDEFVVVEDDELDAVAPDKSKEIDLKRFVPVADIDPMYFQRAYFLAPNQGAIKPYRLLAASMDNTERAGIATCVIRGKEYLLAILSSHGILRAEILRFADEVRTPEDIGLSAPPEPARKQVSTIEKAIKQRSRKTLDADQLTDMRGHAIEALVDDKLEAGDDIITDPEAEDADAPPTDNDPIDLMAVLKQRLSKTEDDDTQTANADEAELTREALYAEAQDKNIKGRSKMTKAELAKALGKAS